jgi:predicted lipoprotein with Yx(FWY)xxD motif
MEKYLIASLMMAGAALAVLGWSAPAVAQAYPYPYGGYEFPQPIDPFIVHGLSIRDDEDYGTYLTDASGRALYLFTADRRGRGPVPAASGCYGPCIKAWPPAYAAGPVVAGKYVDDSQIAIIVRADGTRQVTYNGWPLYYYAGDLGATETQGQEKEQFGGEWYLVSPGGAPLEG